MSFEQAPFWCKTNPVKMESAGCLDVGWQSCFVQFWWFGASTFFGVISTGFLNWWRVRQNWNSFLKANHTLLRLPMNFFGCEKQCCNEIRSRSLLTTWPWKISQNCVVATESQIVHCQSMFDVNPDFISASWNVVIDDGIPDPSAKPTHIPWACMFMKLHPSKAVNCTLIFGANKGKPACKEFFGSGRGACTEI